MLKVCYVNNCIEKNTPVLKKPIEDQGWFEKALLKNL